MRAEGVSWLIKLLHPSAVIPNDDHNTHQTPKSKLRCCSGMSPAAHLYLAAAAAAAPPTAAAAAACCSAIACCARCRPCCLHARKASVGGVAAVDCRDAAQQWMSLEWNG